MKPTEATYMENTILKDNVGLNDLCSDVTGLDPSTRRVTCDAEGIADGGREGVGAKLGRIDAGSVDELRHTLISVRSVVECARRTYMVSNDALHSSGVAANLG